MALPRPKTDDSLLVEGVDDQGVCVAFLRHTGLKAEVIAAEGYESLRGRVRAELRLKGRKALGLIVDADFDAAVRWQSLRDVLAQDGINLPKVPDPQGSVVETHGWPRVGVWLMPDNQLTGMLEDFIRVLVPADDTLIIRAEAAVDAIPDGERKFAQIHRAKAAMHTWLAWQEEPGRPMGQAITRRYLDLGAPSAEAFATWLRRLFG